jgi:hypothetical protein
MAHSPGLIIPFYSQVDRKEERADFELVELKAKAALPGHKSA